MLRLLLLEIPMVMGTDFSSFPSEMWYGMEELGKQHFKEECPDSTRTKN